MAIKTIKLNRRTVKIITDGLIKPFKNTRHMFLSLGIMIDRDTQLTFKQEGAYSGRRKWKAFSPKTLKTSLGTWKIRYGTDKKPKRNMAELNAYKSKHNLWYKRGPMKGYRGDRRYSGSSKLLQASGSFKQSFRILKITNDKMLYGTRHKLADKIMSNPTRNALGYTRQDQTRYGNLILRWIRKGIKF